MKQIIAFTAALLLTCPFLAFSQRTFDDMAMAVLSEKMDKLGDEMDKLGKVMDGHGAEMDKYGKELEKSHDQSPQTEKQMEELGEKMGKLGEEMGKLGEQMGQYGEKMGQLHQQMVNWFFQELKKDGLITTISGKHRIILDEQGLTVDGKKASGEQFKNYKSGFEKYWGQALKSDFLLFFKGSIQEKNGNIETEGSMNTDF